MDNLTRDVLEAERLGYGCHYGNYKADHPHTRPKDDGFIMPPPAEQSNSRICKYCKRIFIPVGNLKHYCSEDCKRSRSLDLGRAAQRRCRGKYPERLCIQCGKPFQPTSTTQECCSRACSAGRRKLSNIICQGCGISFKPRSKHTKYCCRACLEAQWQKRRNKEEMPDE